MREIKLAEYTLRKGEKIMGNSPLKFRAWDNHNKKWLMGYDYPNLGGFSLYGESIMLGEWSKIISDYLCSSKYPHDALKIMQFTGLKDKNGKDIYEGDIVKSSEGISVVKYDGNGFWCCVEGRGFRTGNFFPASVDSEVIGNIYENPELIKEQ